MAVLVIVGGLITAVVQAGPASAAGTYTEYAGGGGANTWTNYTNAGGYEGAHISPSVPIQITCALTGFRVADGNTWWYQIASSPWNNSYYVSADAFYNNGATSGSLLGTPWVDPAVPVCGSGGAKNETTGGTVNTWTNYTNAGGQQGPTIGSNATVSIACATQGFRVADGNTWWYLIASSPWNNSYYASADAFYNNGATSGSLLGTPFVDPAVPLCNSGSPPVPSGSSNETTGGVAHTWTNYTNAGGTQGPSIASDQTVGIACKLTGFTVADGNSWWYQIASSPWNGTYYVSADAFYNNGSTSGSLLGTPFVDSNVPNCDSASTPRPSGETVGPGGGAHTWANYSHAGAAEGPTIPAYDTVQVACRVTGFRVADGDTWWYLVGSAPWDNVFYVSADAFYNNGATSGSLAGTPFVDLGVPICSGNTEAPIYSSAYGSSSAVSRSNACRHADPVNCASGDLWQTYTDVSIAGRGPGISLTRTYNDLSASTQGMFGNGWSSSYDQHLTLGGRDGSILVTLADGSQAIAEPNGSGGFTLPPSTDDTLVQNGNGTYTLTEHATKVLTFTATGQLSSVGDLNGYQTTLAYNASNQLTSVTDTSGRIVQVSHGSNGLVSSVVDPMRRTTTYGYDSTGDLTSVTDPMGRVTTFTYNGSSQMLTMRDPKGGTVTNTFDAGGRVLSQSDPMGRVTSFSYTGDNFSALGGTTTITDPNGNVEVEKYANGFETQVIKAYGTSEQATSTYDYDPSTFGITSATDPNGNVTTHGYDANGNLLSTTDPLGRTTTRTYNALNEVLTSTTALGETTSHTYDANGNLLTTTDPLGGTTVYAYGDGHPGDATSITDPAGEVTTNGYDAYGDNSSKTTAPSSGVTNATNFVFDLDGEQVCSATPDATAAGVACPAAGSARVAGTATTAYDADGEVISSTDAMGNTTSNTYDADGNKTQVADPEGNTTKYTYDPDNELSGTTQPNGGTTSKSYDSDGNVVSTIDAKNQITKDTYDALNRLTSTTNPLNETTSYSYDLDGNRMTTTDPSGRVTSDTYDGDNELHSVSYSDGTTHGVTYAYDSDGDRTSMTDGTGTTTYIFDGLGRLTSSTDGAGAATAYAYDPDSHLSSISYPNGKSVAMAYDGAGEEVSVADWLGNRTAFTYDHDGNELTASVLVVKRGFTYNVTKDTFAYNSDDVVASVATGSGTKALRGFSYGRNADSLVSSVTPTGKATQIYSYNSMNEVTGDSSGTYGYDTAGNLTASLKTTPMTYNAGDELTSTTSKKKVTSYTYNAEDQRTGLTPPTGSSASYGYDQAGRMVSYSDGSTSASYSYNGDGLRMAKTIGGTSTTQFTWDVVASTPLLLSDGASSYIYGPGNLPLESINAAGTAVFYHHDQLGNTTLLTSATGAKLATYTYGSYGNLLKHKGSVTNPLLFDGQYQDAESALYYLQARYYDPTTGQFISVDPDLSSTGEPFEYASDDPVNASDPTGLFCILGHNPNGSCRGSGEVSGAGSGLVGWLEGPLGEVLSGVQDGIGVYQACNGNWAAMSCGIAIQKAGVGAAGDVLGILCGGKWDAPCSALIAAGGQYFLNKYGIHEPSQTSTSWSPAAAPAAPVSREVQAPAAAQGRTC